MTLVTQPPPSAPEPYRRRFTHEEFVGLAEIGLFGPQERVELVEGEIIEKTTQYSPHVTGTCATGESLRRVFGDGFDVRIQMPIALGPMSQPDPDIAVVTGSFRDYETSHPTIAALIVEVSDSSLAFDRSAKAAMYAKAGILDYWILNLNDRILEVYRNPQEVGGDSEEWSYASATRFGESEVVSPLACPESKIVISELLPRRTR